MWNVVWLWHFFKYIIYKYGCSYKDFMYFDVNISSEKKNTKQYNSIDSTIKKNETFSRNHFIIIYFNHICLF